MEDPLSIAQTEHQNPRLLSDIHPSNDSESDEKLAQKIAESVWELWLEELRRNHERMGQLR